MRMEMCESVCMNRNSNKTTVHWDFLSMKWNQGENNCLKFDSNKTGDQMQFYYTYLNVVCEGNDSWFSFHSYCFSFSVSEEISYGYLFS